MTEYEPKVPWLESSECLCRSAPNKVDSSEFVEVMV